MEHVDDAYFMALANDDDEEGLFPISDEKYADGIQLQEVLMSAVIASMERYGPPNNKINVKIERGGAASTSAPAATVLQPGIRIKSEPVDPPVTVKTEASRARNINVGESPNSGLA